MVNWADRFPGTREEYNVRGLNSPESPTDGYVYKTGKNKYVHIDANYHEDGLYVEVHELMTGLTAKPSARIKNLKVRQRERAVWATVAHTESYDTIADAVNAVAAKLRENYSKKYQEILDGPLEKAITETLALYIGVQPPGEA